jgi:hypothetical protein
MMGFISYKPIPLHFFSENIVLITHNPKFTLEDVMMKKRLQCILVIVLLLALGGAAQADSVGDLHTAWDQFSAGLEEGRDGIDTTLPAREPLPPIPVPPADPRP